MDRQLVLFSGHPVHPQWDVSINIWLRNDMMDHFHANDCWCWSVKGMLEEKKQYGISKP